MAGHWLPGDPEILNVMDSGYDTAYFSHVLADLPVVLVGRLRSDRVMLRDAGSACPGPKGGRPRRHGGDLRRGPDEGRAAVRREVVPFMASAPGTPPAPPIPRRAAARRPVRRPARSPVL
ncbi:transposase [Streptomyces sp. AK04-3B]|nr:transposase [Streptomyces sp. AK04-3B]MDX3800590.1 transposase [Streptomyces sp. AK04-3B]